MTSQEWDGCWHRSREEALKAGALPVEADAMAAVKTTAQFGQRPQEAGRE